jgi:ubiquinol-cytochrome c reductase cytochrome c1 subunit
MTPKQVPWSFEGITGTYDRAALNRGLQVYREVCSSCHGLEFVAFRNLPEIMVSRHAEPEDFAKAEAAAKAIAESYTFTMIDEYGDEADRPGTLTDYFPNPFPNENAAMASNSGKVPPDLSLITKARPDGANYLYSLLTGYQDAPADFVPNSDVTYYNPYFEGWEIVMPTPLFEGQVEYADGTEASVEQMAMDVTNFLMWAAEPKLEERHEMGMKVIIYTLFMTIIFYLSMKVIWRRVKK